MTTTKAAGSARSTGTAPETPRKAASRRRRGRETTIPEGPDRGRSLTITYSPPVLAPATATAEVSAALGERGLREQVSRIRSDVHSGGGHLDGTVRTVLIPARWADHAELRAVLAGMPGVVECHAGEAFVACYRRPEGD